MLQERFDVDAGRISAETTVAELGIDSILMVDLMLDIETELDFTFVTMDLPKNPSVGDVADLIQRSMG
ncbi:MAG: acyl carrier protein [Pseudoxanthomonas sp.]